MNFISHKNGLNCQSTRWLAWGLFFFTVLFYAITRYWQIVDFPIYFFSDEAVNAVRAEELIRNGFKDEKGNFLPAYFLSGDYYNISLGVYLQVLSIPLLGKSEWVVRGLVAFLTVWGAIGVSFLLKDFFKTKSWWIAPLWLAATPTWFLHSRTAFEVCLTLSLYPWFLYFYFQYLKQRDWSIYLCVIFGILTFYSYSAGQVIMLISGLGFAFSNLRVHLGACRQTVIAAALTLFLLLPYARYRLDYPDAINHQIQAYNSYLGSNLTWIEKSKNFLTIYLKSYEPEYWFKPDSVGNIRHQVKGRSNLLEWSYPFLILGLILTFFRIKDPYYRCLIIVLLAAPAGSALVERGITRVLPLVLPATLMISIGLEQILRIKQFSRASPLVILALTLALVISSLNLLLNSLRNGSRWYSDYGLHGMQWGARQLLGHQIPIFLKKYPDAKIHLSSSWANGAHLLMEFYDLGKKLKIFDIEHAFIEKFDFPDNTVFVMQHTQFQAMQKSDKFIDIQILDHLDYPDGSPAFYFVSLKYRDDFAKLLQADFREMRKLHDFEVFIGNVSWKLSCQEFEGELQGLFNSNKNNFFRGKQTNPYVIELTPPSPQKISAVTVHFPPMMLRLNAFITVQGSDSVLERKGKILPSESTSSLKLDFGIDGKLVSKLRLEFLNPEDGPTGKIHLTEIELHPLSEPNK
jgi:hypothetical protein